MVAATTYPPVIQMKSYSKMRMISFLDAAIRGKRKTKSIYQRVDTRRSINCEHHLKHLWDTVGNIKAFVQIAVVMTAYKQCFRADPHQMAIVLHS